MRVRAQSRAMSIVLNVGKAVKQLIWPGVLGIKSIPAKTAATVAWIIAARTLWQMPVSQVANVYRTTGNMAATQWISNAQAASLLVITGAVVVFGGRVLGVAAWGTLTVPVAGVCAWLSVVRWRHNLIPNLRYAQTSEFRALLKPSLLFRDY